MDSVQLIKGVAYNKCQGSNLSGAQTFLQRRLCPCQGPEEERQDWSSSPRKAGLS